MKKSPDYFYQTSPMLANFLFGGKARNSLRVRIKIAICRGKCSAWTEDTFLWPLVRLISLNNSQTDKNSNQFRVLTHLKYFSWYNHMIFYTYLFSIIFFSFSNIKFAYNKCMSYLLSTPAPISFLDWIFRSWRTNPTCHKSSSLTTRNGPS